MSGKTAGQMHVLPQYEPSRCVVLWRRVLQVLRRDYLRGHGDDKYTATKFITAKSGKWAEWRQDVCDLACIDEGFFRSAAAEKERNALDILLDNSVRSCMV